MKIVNYKRIEKVNCKTLCTMHFIKNAVILDFGNKQGGKLKLPIDFLADSIEHYLTYIIQKGLSNAAKKGNKSKSHKS